MDMLQFARILEEFHKLQPTIQASTIKVFIYIAQSGSTTQRSIESALGMTNGAASRNVAWWTKRRADRSEGPDFVETVPDDYDRRFNHIRLTSKGKAFWEDLQEKIRGKGKRE